MAGRWRSQIAPASWPDTPTRRDGSRSRFYLCPSREGVPAVEEALLGFRVARLRTFRLLSRLSDPAWDRAVRLPEGGQRTVAEKLRGDVEHDDLHLRQLVELREAWEAAAGFTALSP
jgi:hypothetical protein